MYEKQALHINNRYHDDATKEASGIMRKQIISFHIKPMTPLMKDKKLIRK